MKELRLQYPVPMMCRIYNVSASGYYAYISRPLSKRAKDDIRLEVEIKAAHKRTRRVCGAERLQKDLAENGVEVGVCRIKRIRKKLGIRCKQTKKFKTTTDSKHTFPVAENLLIKRNKNGSTSKPHLLNILTCITHIYPAYQNTTKVISGEIASSLGYFTMYQN